MKNILKEFKSFILGDKLNVAIGLVIGGAFTTLVNALSGSVITPLISLIVKLITGSKNAEFEMTLNIFGVNFHIGDLISAIITFIITAFILFMIIKGLDKTKEKVAVEGLENPTKVAMETRDLMKEMTKYLANMNGVSAADAKKLIEAIEKDNEEIEENK
ncbi:large conductance mechanosensitive channel protein MscL [Vagococcus coleopterorum]|uniref:Large conductance mechanosensitive channel protein MscL n=1 Tax=Vagococcus coleopterorum TaxID=2714946 RepID=A0A6G8APA9_9ENTE|nr:large conductance mechanosensitive channel protein MscL [Vagococcus coleopterorum]QIL46765.1 large conductance mechanosensitive channel protein MscL [Vagococcus coleopterorum]